MIHAQEQKFFMVAAPKAIVNTGDFDFAEIDTIGFEYLQIIVLFGFMDIAITEIDLTEGDESGTNHVALSGADWGTDDNHLGTASTLPTATDDNKYFVYDIDLKYRKRYIDGTITIGTGSTGGFCTVTAILSRAKTMVNTAAAHGSQEIIRL